METITIHQAYYGEVARSHSVIKSTINDSDLKSFLLGFTDRPGTVPPGVTLIPYISCTIFKQYFILTKSFPDDFAERNGMIFTHALIIDKSMVGKIATLNPILNKFITNININRTEVGLESLLYEVKNEQVDLKLPEYVTAVINELPTQSKPIVFIGGHDEFIVLISKLWIGLPPNLRLNFKIGIGFSPQELDQKNLPFLIMSFPELVSKWHANKIITTKTPPEANLAESVVKFLSGERAGNLFFEFLSKLESTPESFNSIKLFNDCFELSNSLETLEDINQVRLFVRMLGKISNDPSKGTIVKSPALKHLLSLSLNGELDSIAALRNLELDSFDPNTVKSFKNKIQEHVLERLYDGKGHQFMPNLINTAYHSDSKESWWSKSILDAVKFALSKPTLLVLKCLWQVVKEFPSLLERNFKTLPINLSNEQLALDSIPENLSPEIYTELTELSEKRHWYRLRAKILLLTTQIEQAIKEQLKFDESLGIAESDGLMLISDTIGSERFIQITLEIDSSMLKQISAQHIVKKPELLSLLDFKNKIAREIWAISLKETKSFEFGLKDTVGTSNLILNLINNGDYVEDEIVNSLSSSKYANIIDYKERRQLWSKLSGISKEKFLTETASGFLQRICDDKNTESKLEPELHTKITSAKFMSDFLYFQRDNMSNVLKVFGFFENLHDKFLADYISYYSKQISGVTSTLLGKLVQSRHWKESAYKILEKAKGNSSFRIALNECSDLIDLGNRLYHFRLFGDSISSSEAWDALTIIAIDNYPKGPEDEDIWERSGGKISKLHLNRNSEENWRRAIGLLRKGGGGKNITPHLLIQKMLSDFPSSQPLKFLRDNFFISRPKKK